MLSIREESCRIVYRDNEPAFVLTQRNGVQWHSIKQASIEDITEVINQKCA